MKILKILACSIIFLQIGYGYIYGRHPIKNMFQCTKENKMDEQEFWKIIDYSFNEAGGNKRMQSKIIVKKLTEYTPEEIVDFELILRRKILDADDYKILAIDEILDAPVSDDTYLYFRCWLIGFGQKTFEQIMKDPDYLAEVVEKGDEPDFEDLLFVSAEAYEIRTGKKDEDDTFPQNVAFAKGLDYDFGGHKTTGKEWQEKELPTLYPKLWNKFN